MPTSPSAVEFQEELEHALASVYGAVPTYDVEKLVGDASTRSYYRVRAADVAPSTLVIMRLPENALGSDEGKQGDDSEAPAGPIPPLKLPFLNVHRLLESRGLRVPRVYHADLARRVVALEDLGDETFEARLLAQPDNRRRLYERAIELVVAFQDATQTPDHDCVAYSRAFDPALLRWELDHFDEWGLCAPFGKPDAVTHEALQREFDALTDALVALPQRLVHRDFQSRNLMWLRDELVLIDFQDALMGPAPYDLVALLCDSYVSLSAEEQNHLLDHYAALRDYDEKARHALHRAFHLTAVQRKLKDAGRFVFIDRVRGNPRFLTWYRQSIVYAARSAETAGLSELSALLKQVLPGYPEDVPTPQAISPMG